MPRMRSYPPDSSVFDSLASGVGSSSGSTEDTDLSTELSELENYWDNLAALRMTLLEIVDYDELKLELALRRAMDEPVRTTASELGIHPSTASRLGRQAFQQVQIGALAKLMRSLLRRDGGATLSVVTWRPINPGLDAYAVSVSGYERKFETLPIWKEIAAWIEQHWETLQLPEYQIDDDLHIRHIGGWYEQTTNTWILDVSVVITGKQKAIAVARKNNQKAIYNFCSGESHVVASKCDSNKHCI